VQQERKPHRDNADGAEDDISHSLAAVDEHLDGLARQIERVTKVDLGTRTGSNGARGRGSEYVADALGRLNRRLDQIINEGRTASKDLERRISRGSLPPAPPSAETPPPPPAPRAAPDPAHWPAEISARQRALDDDAPPIAPAEPAAASLPAFVGPGPDLNSLHEQLQQISRQITSLHQPYEEALTALRRDVAKLGGAVTEAMPHRAIEAIESQVRVLTERLDRLQDGPDGRPRFASLEDRIAKLAEKLDASDAHLNRLDAIEHGLTDMRTCLDKMRRGSGREGLHAIAALAATADAPEPSGHLALAAIPLPSNDQQSPGESDTPLEPGSGGPDARPGSAAARIAASEAALGHLKPAVVENSGKLAALAAARSAARSANLVSAVRAAKSPQRKKGFLFKWPSTAVAEPPGTRPTDAIEPPVADTTTTTASTGKRAVRLLQTLLIVASVVVIVIGAFQTAMEILRSRRPAPLPAPTVQEVPKGPPPASAPGHTMLAPDHSPTDASAMAISPASDPKPTGPIGHTPSFFTPSITVATGLPLVDVTGSLLPPLSTSQAPSSAPIAGSTAAPALMASIGPQLQAAIAANDPAGLYEMGVRYAEGRGMAQNLKEAVRWLERAANAGFIPAQFRLAGLYEKGEGLKKDLQAARRLYRAAATKGNAKAMHNLAVLYAEGVDGTPDYAMAVHWFRKAAGYGVADSQYNLAILYARGIGVEADLPESYKWFALAAASGDADAAKKRDEVGARLDQQKLMAAKLAAQTFVPQREPDEATNLKAPPGGWDQVSAPPAKVRAGSLP
jgi:TPR repeat protein